MNAHRVIKAVGMSVTAATTTVRVGRHEDPEFVPQGDGVPEIKLISQDGTVQRIEIRCVCGQTTTLICDYTQPDGSV
jgi:hypothetical protein